LFPYSVPPAYLTALGIIGPKKLHGFPFAIGHLGLDRGGHAFWCFFYTADQIKKREMKTKQGEKKPGTGKFCWKRRKFAILDAESGGLVRGDEIQRISKCFICLT
jgi:hypothetical protein